MHLLAVLSCVVLFFQQPGGKPGVAAPPEPKLGLKLLGAADAVKAGGEIEIAVEFDVPKPWHTYHPIVLDTGFATDVRFRGPKGANVDNLRWPTPSLESVGDIEYLELKGKFAALATLHVDKNVRPGTNLTIAADATALECIEACVPVDGKATLTIPVAAEDGKPANEKVFNDARGKLPAKLSHAQYLKGSKIAVSKEKIGLNEPAEIVATIKVQSGHHIQDRKPGVEGLIGARFFIEKRDGIEFASPKDEVWPEAHVREMPGLGKVREQAGEFTVRIPFKITDEKFPSGPVELRVLFQYQCCTDAGQCYAPALVEANVRFNAETANPPDDKRTPYMVATVSDTPPPPTETASVLEILWQVVCGLLGGLILNIMPCVLPVMSIKIMSFVKQGGDDPRRALRLSLVFAAGVVLWFWLMAVITGVGSIQLRNQFQNPLQDPWVTFTLATVVFAMALNMFGVFEFVLPGSAASKLDEAARKEGYSGALAKGFLATLLGTACAAPVLTPAMAWAVTQPMRLSFLVFTAAGVGMSLPYVILAANPKWLRFIPKPGMWMVYFKQAMGFVLVATAIWLIRGLRKQPDWGADGIVVTIAFWAFLGAAAWLIGRARPTWSRRSVVTAWLSGAAIAMGGYWFSFHWLRDMHKALEGDIDEIARSVNTASWDYIPWVAYKPGLAEEFAKRGYTVYVDYTADWCPTCKFNLHTVLETEAIRSQMKRLGVIPIEADFTAQDPQMRKDITEDGRLSVSVNRIYPAGKTKHVLLPIVLTIGTVSEELEKAGPSVAKTEPPQLTDAAQPSPAN